MDSTVSEEASTAAGSPQATLERPSSDEVGGVEGLGSWIHVDGARQECGLAGSGKVVGGFPEPRWIRGGRRLLGLRKRYRE